LATEGNADVYPHECWAVEIAFPWSGLARFDQGRATPPTTRRRVARQLLARAVKTPRRRWSLVRIPPHGTPRPEGLDPEQHPHPEDNWVWSPQGAINMHLPGHWGTVVFER
jgi:hypothetical protein